METVSLLLVAASLVGAHPPVESAVPPRAATVCEAAVRSSEFSGRIQLRGMYQTDFRHFAHLQDKSCGTTRNLLFAGSTKSDSYQAMKQAWLAECERSGDAGLCVVDAPVTVIGTLRVERDGVYIDIEEMLKASTEVREDGT